MTIYKQALKRILFHKLRLLVLLLMPLLFIALFALQDERTLTIGIVDHDQSYLSIQLTKYIENMDKVVITQLAEKEVYDKTVSYQTDYTLIITEGFEKAIISGKDPQVSEFYLHEKEKLYYVKNLVESFIFNMHLLANGAHFQSDRFFQLVDEYEQAQGIAVYKEEGAHKIDQTRQAMGFLVQFLLYMSVVTASLILEDKNNGVFYRTFYAPISLKRYMMENLLAFLSVAVVQIGLIIFLLKVGYNMDFANTEWQILVVMIVFGIVCICLGMWMISIFKKPLGAYITIILITTPLVMLGGCYWPMEFMPTILQQIALFIPTTWIMSSVDQILYESKTVFQLYLELLILTLFSGIFLASGLLKKIDISK